MFKLHYFSYTKVQSLNSLCLSEQQSKTQRYSNRNAENPQASKYLNNLNDKSVINTVFIESERQQCIKIRGEL